MCPITYMYPYAQGHRDARTPQIVRQARVQRILGKLAGAGQVLRLPRGQHPAIARRQYIFET